MRVWSEGVESGGVGVRVFRGEGELWKGFDNWIEMRREGEI